MIFTNLQFDSGEIRSLKRVDIEGFWEQLLFFELIKYTYIQVVDWGKITVNYFNHYNQFIQRYFSQVRFRVHLTPHLST